MTKKQSKPFGHDRKVTVRAKYIDMLEPLVCKDLTRYQLGGIFVTPCSKGGVLLVAADGVRLGVIHDEKGSADKPWICPISTAVLRACRDRGQHEHGGLCHFVGEFSYVTDRLWKGSNPVTVTKHHQVVSFSPPLDGIFPDWEKVIPNKPDSDKLAHIGFNPRLLSEFRGVSEATGLRAGSVTLVPMGVSRATVVLVDAVPEFYGVIMPMKVKPPTGAPAWLGAGDKQAIPDAALAAS